MKKMEKEMENVFETKVKEKKQKLKDSEHELTQKHKNVSFTMNHTRRTPKSPKIAGTETVHAL